MELISVIAITATVMLLWMFFQVAWIGSRILDKKMLKDVQAPPDHIRKEQRSIFFTFVVFGTGTMAFSYIVGIASSWSAEEILVMDSVDTVERPFGVTGSILFAGSLFIFAIFTMFLFAAHFRTRPLSAAELVADIRALEAQAASTSRNEKLKKLELEMTSTRKTFRKQWHANGLTRRFYCIFMMMPSRASYKRSEVYRFALQWQWNKKSWKFAWFASAALAAIVVIEAVWLLFLNVFPVFPVLIVLIIALVLAGFISWLQIMCACAELRYLAADIRLELARFKAMRVGIAGMRASQASHGQPLSARTSKLLFAIGPLQLWI